MENLNTNNVENNNPKIYVADLAAYNNGYLHGVWIDATEDLDAIQDQVNDMLKTSPIDGVAEEWAIHDFECFAGYHVGEYDSLETLHEIALFLEEHGDAASAALSYCSDLDEAREMVEDRYHGCHDSEEEFAAQLYEDCYEIPEYLQYYIDYEKVARDLFINDFISVAGKDHQIHVFSH